jgi:hypothetical protein
MANIKISELPSATTPLSGTEEVPIVQGGQTVKVVASEFGGTPAISTLNEVLTAGNTSSNYIRFTDENGAQFLLNPAEYFILANNGGDNVIELKINLFKITDNTIGGSASIDPAQLQVRNDAVGYYANYKAEYINFIETFASTQQYLYPSPAFDNQKVYLPAYNGTLATTQPQFQATINSTPYTINGADQNLYTVVTGANNIILNPANWLNRITVTLLVDITGTSFSTTGGATIRGAVGGTFAISVGMVSVMYFQSNNTFYISRS